MAGSAEAVVPRAAGSGQRRGGATIPLSSMSRFSLLQVDVQVEEPETSENPPQSFEIHNIVWRRTHIFGRGKLYDIDIYE